MKPPITDWQKKISLSACIFIGVWNLKIARWWWKKMALKWLSPLWGLAWRSSIRLAATLIKQNDKHANRSNFWTVAWKENKLSGQSCFSLRQLYRVGCSLRSNCPRYFERSVPPDRRWKMAWRKMRISTFGDPLPAPGVGLFGWSVQVY